MSDENVTADIERAKTPAQLRRETEDRDLALLDEARRSGALETAIEWLWKWVGDATDDEVLEVTATLRRLASPEGSEHDE